MTERNDSSDEKLKSEFCNQLLKEHASSPTVLFMLNALKEKGCLIPKISCVPCAKLNGGGVFNPPSEILICQDAIQSKSHVHDTMVHELLHAYDNCRIKFDMMNCAHRVCTEVRAANLSGDCKWSREFMRGNLGFSKQHKICVKRRARLSVQGCEACKGVDLDALFDRVFDGCLKDTAPFIDIP